jgi:hypothetical protein
MKYRKGSKITNISDIVDREFIYYRHKLYHAGWFSSWSLNSILQYLKQGEIYTAEVEKENNGIF